MLQQTGELKNKNAAKECYFSDFSGSHENLTIRDSGLIVNPNYPYIGASPAAIVECKCCGIRCLQIKCPYSRTLLCESKTCKIQWVHIKCMRIKKIPKCKWFCVKCKTQKRQLRQ